MIGDLCTCGINHQITAYQSNVVGKIESLSMAFLLLMTTMIGCFGSEYDLFVEYDIDEANQIWEQYDVHQYEKRTPPTTQSIEIADNLVQNNEIYLMRYWDSFVFEEDELDWSEDP